MKKKTSILWKVAKGKLEEVISQSYTIREVLAYFGLQGNNHKTFHARIKFDNIDISGLCNRSEIKRYINSANSRKKSLSDVMVKNSTYPRGCLKKRLIKDKILRNECYICGLKDKWNDKPIVMVLDHINGSPNDHRLTNLRLLCPNCNSQQSTFAGRNYKREKKPKKKNFCKCGKEIRIRSLRCRKCNAANNKKVTRPSEVKLEKMIDTMSWCAIGRKYNVSDNAVRKWARKYNII